MNRKWYRAFIAVFFLCCLIPSVGMLIFGAAPAAANELPMPKPALTDYNGHLDTAFFSDLQNYVANGFFGRLQGITAWNRLSARVFDTSANDDVLIGPDGWLFYGEAARELSGAEQMTEREIWCAARSLYLMQEYTQSQGADFLFAAVCGKYSLYPDHAPEYVTVAEGSDREHLEAALAEQGVNYVNLYDAFSQQDEILYWQWDSHWNSKGAALAADAILNAAGREGGYFAGPFTEEMNHRGDLYEMLYPTGKALETDYLWQPGFTFSYVTAFRSADDIIIQTENPAGQGSLLMFRDSSGRSLYPYMAQSFEKAYFSRQNNQRIDYVNSQNADLVVIEMAERTLGYLLTYPAVFPSPVREDSVLDGTVTVMGEDVSLAAEAPGATMEGYVKVTGTLPDVTMAADSPIYVTVDGVVYEAIPGGESFTAWLPDRADWENARIDICI